ncbi:MAG: aldo/keto reductase [Acidaminococcus provencensis]|jgi:diketogulonate reductase-like aldo/keto reductase|uniref:aldo/keto reductase n=1 Tax=Acidaminococcus provencensis TaxID=2058289 RepID=UPI0023F06E6B|nr:aldo/keto reductase [Acidaminococcus provencensis]MCH4096637.1 aldo/keto reductase [Acidaminococcus provencensis]
MEYFTLNNGVKLPAVGFGTWDVRGEAGKQVILTALEVGYRLIDTAQMYGNEEIVGQAVRESGLARKDVFITTKLYRPSCSYQKAKEGIAKSLEALQTDYLDLLLIHEPYEQALEMYEALKEAYAAGKVRAIGISNFEPKDYDRFLKQCGLVPAVNQVEAHVYYPQLELKAQLDRQGTQMQSWGPFTEGRRNIFAQPLLNQIGAKYGKTAGQTALRYLLQNGIAVIPKSVHRERMEENLHCLDFQLTPEDMAQLSTLNEGRSLFGWY